MAATSCSGDIWQYRQRHLAAMDENVAWQKFTQEFSGSMLLAVGQAQDAEAYLELTSQLGLTRSQLDSVLRQVETACLPRLLQLFDLFRAHLADTEASQHWEDAAPANETLTAHTQDIDNSIEANTEDTEDSTQVHTHTEDDIQVHSEDIEYSIQVHTEDITQEHTHESIQVHTPDIEDSAQGHTKDTESTQVHTHGTKSAKAHTKDTEDSTQTNTENNDSTENTSVHTEDIKDSAQIHTEDIEESTQIHTQDISDSTQVHTHHTEDSTQVFTEDVVSTQAHTQNTDSTQDNIQDTEDSIQAHTQDSDSTQVQHSEDSTSAHAAGAPGELSGGVVGEQADTSDGLEHNSQPRGHHSFTKAWAEVFGTSQQVPGSPGKLFQCPSCVVLFPHLTELMQHLARDHESIVGALSQQPHVRKLYSLNKEHGYAGKDDTPSQSTVKTNLSDKQTTGSNRQGGTSSHHGDTDSLALQGQSLLSDATEDSHTFTCGMCSRVFPSLSTMAHHMAVSHPKANVKKCLQCGLCGWKSMTGRMGLRKHIVSIHASFTDQICGYCGKVFQSRYRCVNHMLRHFASRQAGRNKMKDCNKCMTKFATRVELRAHLKTCNKRGVAHLSQFGDSAWPPGGLHETDEASALDVEEAEDNMGRQPKRGRPPGSKNKVSKRPTVYEEDSVSTRGEEAMWEAEDVAEESSNGMEGQAVSPHSSAKEKQQLCCQKCGVTFFTKSAISSHIHRKHYDYKHLLCRWCGQMFEDASQRRVHIQKHLAENREKNRKAREMVRRSASAMRRQVKRGRPLGSKRKLSKSKRPRTYEEDSVSRGEEAMWEDEDVLHSSDSKVGEESSNGMEEQAVSAHSSAIDNEGGEKQQLCCQKCGVTFFTKSAISSHIHRKHYDYKHLLCRWCGQMFEDASQRRVHIQKHLAESREKNSKAKEKVRRSVSRGEEAMCEAEDILHSEVGEESSNGMEGQAVSAHSSDVDNEGGEKQQICCEMCGVTFFTKGAISSHIHRKHYDDKHLLCRVCGKLFEDASQRRVHLQKHVAESREKNRKAKKKVRRSVSRGEEAMYDDEHILHSSDSEVEEESGIGMEGQAVSPHSSAIDNEGGEEQQICCEMCGKSFLTKGAMSSHIHRKHYDDKHLLCRLCGKMFEDESQRLEHVQKHMAENREKNQKAKQKVRRSVLQCGLCKRSFKNLEQFRNHCVSQHFKERHRLCSTCGRLFPSARERAAHKDGGCLDTMSTGLVSRNKKRELGPGTCGLCGKVSRGERGLELHIKRRHPKVKNLLCVYCGHLFATEDMCFHHTKQHVEERKTGYNKETSQQTCAVCARMFSLPSKLSAHIAQNHTDQAEQICPDCGALFATLEECEEHKKTSHAIFTMSSKPSLIKDKKTCGLCGSVLSCRKTMNAHINSMHSKEKDHMCACCGKYFPEVEDCLKHKEETKSRPNSASLACPHCLQVFRSRLLLDDHIKRHLNEQDFQCDVKDRKTCGLCGNVLGNRKTMTAHINSMHSKEKDHMCSCCGKFFPEVEDCLRHKEETKSKPNSASLACPHCLQVFRSRPLLDDHIKRHLNEQDYQCDVKDRKKCALCGSVLSNRKTMHDHIKSMHSKEQDHMCSCCGKFFPEADDCLKHKQENKAKAKNTSLSCPYCLQGFKVQWLLDSHVKRHLNQRDYQCDVCGSCFFSKSSLSGHMKTHSSDKFQCPQCDKTMSTKYSLDLHLKVHNNDRPFTCDICNKGFTNSTTLRLHRSIHTGEKPYGCEICGKRSRTKADHYRHMPVHSEKKNFVCKICGKAYRSQSGLFSHKNTHTGLRPYVCSVCGRAYKQSESLRKHLKRSHKSPTGPASSTAASIKTEDPAMATTQHAGGAFHHSFQVDYHHPSSSGIAQPDMSKPEWAW